ncbi:MAG: PEP-CTERM sorting domain-containing protein [Pseudomonadota bacterium]
MAELIRKTLWLVAAIAAAALLLAGPAPPALASSFEFGGNNRVKVQSGGHIDPYYSTITDTSGSLSDPANNLQVGLERLDLFDALGVGWVQVGQTYSGFDYTFGNDVDFWLYGGDVNWNSPARNQEPSSFDFGGRIHLTSISFTSNWEINLGGYLSDISLGQYTTSSLLQDLADADQVNISLSITLGSKTKTSYGSFVNVLNSSSKSTWGALSGSITGVNSPSVPGVPEPATGLLLASSLGLGAWLRRRQAKAKA